MPPNQRMKLSWRGGRLKGNRSVCLDRGRRTTQLMRDSLGGFATTTHMTPARSAFRPFAIALACTSGLFALAFWIPQEAIAATSACLSILLGLPICVLLYRDGIRARKIAQPSNGVASAVLELPMRILGAICLLTGIAILAWIAYNLFVERQPQFTGIQSLGQLILPVLLIIFGYRWLRRPLGSTLE